MGEEKEKEKKKKKKKDKKEKAEEEEAPPPAEESEKKKSTKKKSSKKRASGAKLSGPLSIFSEKQLAEFKQGFNYMDQDKDGIITKGDLFRTFDIVGKLANDAELEELLAESDNPITFTQFLSMLADRMQGKADDDDVIIDSFKKFDEGDGSIEPEQFSAMLKGKGEPLSQKEVDEIVPELPRTEEQPHPRWISLKGVLEMVVSPQDDEEATESEAEPA